MLDALAFVEGQILGDEGRGRAVPREVADRVVLVAGEVLSNAVEHGGEDAARHVTVAVEHRGPSVDLVVGEPQPGVPLSQIEGGELPLDPLSIGGRGLFLIQSLTDRIEQLESGRLRYQFAPR